MTAKKGMQQGMDSRAQHFMVYWFPIIFFLSYYFLKFDEFIFFLFKIHITAG